MWQMLKAEIEYNNVHLVVAYLLAVIFLVSGFVWNLGGVHGLTGAMTTVFIIFIILIGTNSDKEKRERYQALLPVPLKHRSFARLIFVVGFQLSLSSLYFLRYFIRHLGQDDWTFWSILSVNALILLIANIFIQFEDLGHFHVKRYRWLLMGVLISLVTVLALLAYNYSTLRYLPVVFGYEIQRTALDVMIFYTVSVSLLFLSHEIYMRRKSYLA